MSKIYETGCIGRKKWWTFNGKTPSGMVIIERLEWAEDSIVDAGVLIRTGETIRRKPYSNGNVYCKKFGEFTEPRNADGWTIRNKG